VLRDSHDRIVMIASVQCQIANPFT